MTGYELLEEVKKRYPPGTQFQDIDYEENIQTIPKNPEFTFCSRGGNDLVEEVDLDYDYIIEESVKGLLYNEGKWATIISKTHEVW